YFFIILHDEFLVSYEYLIIGFYLLQASFILREIYITYIKKPIITFRVTVIIFLTLVTVLAIFAIPLVDRFFWLIFIDLITPLLVGFYVLIFAVPTEIYNDWLIEKAGRKIRAHPKLLVIAVTGSVGKSLTKDYIASVLRHKFTVVKTENKDNNLIGVSRTILKKIESDTQIFVAEISAYKPGEIKMLSQLIRPEIGVLTAINNQHVSLFKSLENIIKTNFELVESLSKNGICLFNGDNKNTLALYKKSKKNKVLYHTAINLSNVNVKNEIIALGMTHKQKRTNFNITLNGQELVLNFNTNHIDRVLPAIYLARHLGMTDKEIRRAVALLK
ncbi:MAG TPA: Mur ligase family protein, partial [Patescibacteria group bacterium]